MSFSDYVRQSIWEFVLVCLVSTALVYTVLNGFMIAPALQYSPFPAVVAVIVTALLFVVGFNAKTVRVGVPLFALCAVASLVVAAGMSGGGDFLADAEENRFFFALVSILVPVLVYALSRVRAGTGVLYAGGAFACALIQFLYGKNELVWMLLFVLGATVLVIYRNYRLSAASATSVKAFSFSAGAVAGVAAAAAALGMGCLLWFVVIAPLNPPAVQVKLFTEIRAHETQLVQGSSNTYLTPRLDLTSNNTTNEERTTDDLKQSSDGRPMPAKPKDSSTTQQESSGTMMGLDFDSLTKAFDFEENPETARRNWLFLLLIPVAIAAFFVGRRLWRKRRLDRIRRLEPSQQAEQLYPFLVERLARVGIAMPPGVTALEFARNNETTLHHFDEAANASFSRMTDLYCAAVYGGCRLDQSQADVFSSYYRGFWKAARKQLGNVKYLVRSFKL